MNNKIKEICIPAKKEYDFKVVKAIRRRQKIKIDDGKLITETGYTVGGMRYKVNSIFDIENSPKSEEALKNLMAKEINNAS